MAETYKQARERIVGDLRGRGWRVESSLKTPYATSSDGSLRIWFRAQAVYYTVGEASHRFEDTRSLHLDTRGLSADALVEAARQLSSLRVDMSERVSRGGRP